MQFPHPAIDFVLVLDMFTPQQKCMQVRGMQVEVSPLDLPCERPVTYQETLTQNKQNNIHISLRVTLVILPESCLAYLLFKIHNVF
jgi:hypothetical protein